MRTILDLCIDMDSFAHRTYEAMASHCQEPDLADVFVNMAAEESNHIGWWQAWVNGF